MRKKLIEMFNGKVNGQRAIEVITSIGYLTLLEKGCQERTSLDFSTHSYFNKRALELSDKVEPRFGCIIKDIIVSGIIEYCKEANLVYTELKKMDEKELIKLITIDLFALENLSGDELTYVTSLEISDLVLRLFENKKVKSIMDICSGSGNFLTMAAEKFTNAELYGIELQNKVNIISRIRLAILNTKNTIIEENVLKISLDRKYDLVFSSFPWNMRLTNNLKEDKNPRINIQNIKLKSDWAFVKKAVNSFSLNGKAVVLINEGCLINNIDKEYRKEILEKKLLEMVIALPSGTMLGANSNYSMLVFSEHNTYVKMIGASSSYVNNGKCKTLDVDAVLNIISKKNENYKEVLLEDIREEGYCLGVERYFQAKINILNPVKLEEVASTFRGYSYNTKKYHELEPSKGEYAILKLSDISNGKIDFDQLKTFNGDSIKLSKYVLKEGDIVCTSRGPAFKVSLISHIGELKIVPSASLMVIRPDNKKINSIYLYLFFNDEIGKMSIKRIQTGGIILVISKQALDNLKIPLVDKEIQEIVSNQYKILNKKIEENKKKLETLESKLNGIISDMVCE